MKQITFLLSVFLLPAAAVEAQDRSQLDQLMDPQLDNAARVEGERICFPYLRTGARPAEVCVPAVNFADTVAEATDMSALTFAGNTLATSPADLARCRIRINTDPGIDDRTLNDPAISQQLNVICPSRREGGGTYRLTVMFNRHYYLPLQLSDTVCGPDRSVLGSEFDRYVRYSLGEPSQVETDQNTAKAYYWLNTSTTMALAPESRGRQTACDSPTSTQMNWSGKIMLNNAVGDPWVAYLRTAAQRQRDGSFTRF